MGSDEPPSLAAQSARDIRWALEQTLGVVTTTLRGETWLRTSLMSPTTTEADLVALLDAIRSASTVV